MKTLIIPNSNNKLQCESFLHIAARPSKVILASDLPQKFIIQDKSETPAVKFEAELVDILPTVICDLPSVITYAASGMDYLKFQEQYIKQNIVHTKLDEVAVYIYRKC